jgi:hypothetical protein
MDYTGVWRNRIYDNRIIVNLMAGYRPGNAWEYSVRWNYAGGVPYTPFDQARSVEERSGIEDPSRIMAERYPAYHSLNVRVDRRFIFEHSSITAYLNVMNTYNRENVASYYWDAVDNRQRTDLQFTLLPIIGMEYEF